MRFDTKIGIVVREDLADWQKLNVTAFLASAIAGGAEDVMGEPYADAAGNTYLAMIRQPILVYSADAEALARTHTRALSRDLPTAVYIEDMFKTTHDEANRAAVLEAPADALPLVGLAVYGPRTQLDKTLKGLTLHT
ncbi:DUF2000 family protein [Sphaerisporangium sp. TRM90804]|uniref:DUF2000 family protein n=1 Tax=Sphaerisporangium sp. TRM90804 TaxID=3031113 RepID=UPI0024473B47|nr:DUF2000 family protein [Sphaerisporangium sp. TRM90804]MDH2427761.1 DUF2000 family protein [Sphaerisporangium sp. TRM90804]